MPSSSRIRRSSLGIVMLVMVGASQGATAGSDEGTQFRLQDFQGAWHSSEDVRECKLVVLAFLGVDCPLTNQYAPRLAELAQEFGTESLARH